MYRCIHNNNNNNNDTDIIKVCMLLILTLFSIKDLEAAKPVRNIHNTEKTCNLSIVEIFGV